jgi:hypothetical protein
MNRGLTELLKNGFPNVKAAKRPCVDIGQINQTQWMAGFATGDGCFLITISKMSSTRTKPCVHLHFTLTQHARDTEMMRRCIDLFQGGSVIKDRTCYYFRISKFEDLFTKVLPIFKEAPILGNKAKDFKD